MGRRWSARDLVECWTLLEDDWRLLRNKTGASRLGFGLLLKFFELRARFPRHAGEIPRAAVEYVAEQVMVDPSLFAEYAFSGPTIEDHRAEIRRQLGFRELLTKSLAAAEGHPLATDLHLLLRINQAGALSELGQYEEAISAAREVRQLVDRGGSVVRLAQAQSALGRLLFETGRWDDALVEVGLLPDELKNPMICCGDHSLAALIYLQRGDAQAGRRHLAAGAAHAECLQDHVVAALASAVSLEREQRGAPADALVALIWGLADESGRAELMPDVVRLAMECGDIVTARAGTAHVQELLYATAVPPRLAAASYCRGLVDRKPLALLRAAEQYHEAGQPLSQAKALEAAAVTFAERGERGTARTALDQAVDLYTSLGADWHVHRTLARLRDHGIRRGPHAAHQRSRSGWESLTATEVTVAGLVADGLSNPQIANRLFLSPRTVATHVSHILVKLDVCSRTDIVREASHRLPVPIGDTGRPSWVVGARRYPAAFPSTHRRSVTGRSGALS